MPRRPPQFVPAALLLTLASLVGAAAQAEEASPSFRRDVMAVLSKAGCNLGTCHGNANGKGGFKLSLRGEDPAADYQVLTRDVVGRRINPLSPEDSLILRKPTLQMPHEGGGRFRSDSPEFAILRDWIAAGGRNDRDSARAVAGLRIEPREAVVTAGETVSLQVFAEDADGALQDVTRWAVYEPSQPTLDISIDGQVRSALPIEATIAVRYLDRQLPVRVAFVRDADMEWSGPEPQNRIDEFVFQKQQQLKIQPAPLCDDVTFLRRATLDLLGLPPTADEARRFLASSDPHKRGRLIDELLDRPEFAEHWALKWADLLRSEEKTLDRKGVENLHAWLKLQLARDEPWNELAHQLLSASGSTYAEPATNYYRALRDPFVRAETTAQVFLGVRLQCAKCHSHPFDRWTQDDYYAWANAFARVDYKIVENKRRDDNDSHEFDGEQIVFSKPEGDVKDPRTGRPRPARVLSHEVPPIDADRDRRQALADWVVDPANPYFARAQVNRVWFHLLGRGLVDPIDDFRITNPASHPELLDWLADEFVAGGCRIKPLVRMIMRSATYQLACDLNESSHADESNYSHTVPRRLSAETLADAMALALDAPVRFKGYPGDVRAGQLPGVGPMRARDGTPDLGDRFLKTFGKPPRLQSCECERVAAPTLAQTFQLISGGLLDDLLRSSDNRIRRALEQGQSDSDTVRELYWAALSREPVEAEFLAAQARLASADGEPSRRAALEDIAWALVNSNEFLFRR
ncbi:MAG: DUF1549 domain-containing protein [Planctomyces sp.]|nr:DUF1549 domain-containing protein [Planctomyces sp.]